MKLVRFEIRKRLETFVRNCTEIALNKNLMIIKLLKNLIMNNLMNLKTKEDD